MTANTLPDQSEVADHIEDFVAHEFVGKPQRLLAQHRFAAHNDCVFEAAALDEIFVHERLNVLVVNKRPRRSDFAFEHRRRDLHREKLRELIIWSGLRT